VDELAAHLVGRGGLGGGERQQERQEKGAAHGLQ
jgi:hypothetical protein